MLTYKNITLEDREIFEPFMKKPYFQSCIQSFQTLMLWSKIYNTRYAVADGWLLVRSGPPEYYTYPFGSGDVRDAIELLLKDAHESGEKLRFHGLTREQKELLEQLYPGKFSYTPDRSNAEYIYEASKLATFAGKKLHAKRNFINRFVENHPDWRFEPITGENIPAIKEMHREWTLQNEGTADGLHEEGCVVRRCLNDYDKLGMAGGVLWADGKVMGFSITSPISDTMADINIEKAVAEEPGAYPMVCREMVKMLMEKNPSLQFVNREEDMGEEGLRKSKESYQPIYLLEKFITEEI